MPKNSTKQKKSKRSGKVPQTVKSADRHIRDIVRSEIKKEISPEELSCIKEYALARSNPFAVKSLPCAITSDPTMSLRWKAYSRGEFITSSTTGFGFIVVDPHFGYNTGAAGYLSLGNFAGSGIDTNAVGTQAFGMTAPYSEANITKSKIVGFGIKVWYTGKALDARGMIYRVRSPNNEPIVTNTYPINSVYLSPINTWSPVSTRTNYFMSFIPASEGDAEFQTRVSPTPTSPRWSIGFLVNAGAAESLNFNFEIVAFYEGIGSTSSQMAAAIYSPEYKVGGATVDSSSITSESLVSTRGPSSAVWPKLMGSALRAAFTPYLGPHVSNLVASYVESSGTAKEDISMSGRQLMRIGDEL